MAATPFIQPGGVTNAASLAPRGLPSGNVAQGSLIRIVGLALGPVTPVTASAFPLAPSLAGVSVTATPAGGAAVSCLPLTVSDTRVDAVLTAAVPLGDVSIRVIVNGIASNPSTATVVSQSPGLFSVLDTGYGPGQIFNHAPSKSPNTLNNPELPGDTATLTATGLGASLPAAVQAFIGNQAVGVVSVTKPSLQPGVDSIVVQVPSSVLTGCYVPVQLKAGGVVSNMVTMAVSSHGQCSDPSNPFTAALRIGGNLGTLGIVHSSAALSAFPGDGVADQAFAVFQSKPAVVNNQVFDRLYSYPPPGACTLYNGRGNLLAGDGVPIPSPGLKAGALGLTGSANSQNLDYFASPGFYFKLLSVTGFGLPPFGSMPLSPGNYTMNSDGAGPQIGGFQSGATLPGPAAWVSPDKLAAIPRTQPLNVTWSAPAGGQVLIAGGDYDSSRDVSAAFLCAAAAAAGALAVPTEILQAIPALQPSQIPNTGRILLGFFPAPAPFTAAGLNFGAFIAPSYLEREVIFQ